MIYFFADNHYGVHPGREIFTHLPEKYRKDINFSEDDWHILENSPWEENCSLLILNLIGGTCGMPHPGCGAEERVRRYLENGGSILLLHGASAAFWQWDWWRALPGERWVRPDDPDGMDPSVHPVDACRIVRSKSRHPLAAKLAEMDLPEDEIYTELENTCPVSIIMETRAAGMTSIQCCEAVTPWGGRIVSFIPGHKPEVTSSEVFIRNITVLIDYLTKGKKS